jgi:hypothetical protein
MRSASQEERGKGTETSLNVCRLEHAAKSNETTTERKRYLMTLERYQALPMLEAPS